ncbi:MAG: EscU/YscU/HrcU family type III secretion system export apparatus switch protein [Bacillota bacterium]
MEEKREAPTPRRRERARREGQVARSPELSGAATLAAAYIMLKFTGAAMFEKLLGLTKQWLSPTTPDYNFLSVTVTFGAVVIPLLLVVGLVGLVSQVAQGGVVLSGALAAPRLERLNPVRALAQLVSRRHIVDWVKNVGKMGILGWILWDSSSKETGVLVASMSADVMQATLALLGVIDRVVYRCALVLLLFGAADYVYQWGETEQSLRMTRSELKEELKETEGRSEVKSRVRSAQRKLAMMRMMWNVKKADVVVTNPDEYAVALKYEALRMAAPVVVAKGRGYLAARIKEEARKALVSIVPNPPLARALYSSTEVGQMIPPELYRAVAEVLAFVYRVKHRL